MSMISKNNAQPSSTYPWEQFPDSLNGVLLEMQSHSQAPMAMVGTSLLASISLVLQGLFDVHRPNGIGSCPLSINAITIAISGERKSTVDKETLRPITEFEKKETDNYKAELIRYDSAFQIWEIEHTALTALKKRLSARILNDVDGNDALITADKQCNDRILKHLNTKPKKPTAFRLLYANVTMEALLSSLYNNMPSAGIITDEGEIVLNSRASSNLASLNSLWSGSSLNVNTLGRGDMVLDGARLTWSVMIQPEAFDKFLEGKGIGARDLGFLARCLSSFPMSTQGTRFIYGFSQPSREHSNAYNSRMTYLLEMNLALLNEGEQRRAVLAFSPEAQLRWISAYNEIEAQIFPGGWLSDIKDYASKIAENIARIAAIFHGYSGFEGDITLDTMNRAINVSVWYANEFKKLFAPTPEVPIVQSDASHLEAWLAGLVQSRYCYWLNGIPFVKKNHIRQLGPNTLRNKQRLNDVIDYMEFFGKIKLVKFGKILFVELNIHYFGGLKQPLQIQGSNNYLGQQQALLPNGV